MLAIALLLACSGPSTDPATASPTGPSDTDDASTDDTSTTHQPTDSTPASSTPTGDTSSTDTATTEADEPARTVELFGPAPHPALTVRVHARAGSEPTEAALDLLRDALADLQTSGHVVKPGGVLVERGTVGPAGTQAEYTFADLDAALDAVRGPYIVGDAAVVHVLYSDGRFDHGGPGTVLGFAYGGAHVVMMRDGIDDACEGSAFDLLPGPLVNTACETLEAAVLLHELGHLFGLVDNGLAMVEDHVDAEHGAHDIDEDCLMYWAADTSDYASTLATRFLSGDTAVPGFDDACLADMAAALP